MDATAAIQRVEDAEGVRVQAEFTRFLQEFVENNERIYKKAIEDLANPEKNTLYVDMAHVHRHSASLASGLELQFYRLYPFVCSALQLSAIDACTEEADRERLHRKQLYVSFFNIAHKHAVRELSADKIGTLVQISGQIVRTHAVHPELSRATFICEDCGVATKDIQQQFRYTQPTQCSNAQCQNRTRFRLDVDDSTFVDFQKVRIQETQAELPRGSIPRSVDVIVRGELVETAQPGDRCDLVGTLIVIPDVAQFSTPGVRAEASNTHRGRAADKEAGLTGLKALGVRDLNYRLAFLACHITSTSATFGGKDYSHEELTHLELWRKMTLEEQRKLKEMSEDKDIARNLTDSLFPNIYGHDEVKLGVLLMLFGGVAKRSPSEGTTLRGDINVCLVGDPSTAKSQILKTIEEFSPRAIYTSGKASSAAGLTAAVVKDEESFEFVIEAGALMLADNGVCCIDEFDKMDQKDQVAIHEAMEQQTISITKAGVKATLNARASILAAANPIGGRYDRSRPLKHNVQLSAPIMSRFDLFFVMIDECNEAADYAIANRILETHKAYITRKPRPTKYTLGDIHKYIMFAKRFNPKISSGAADALVAAYKRLRLSDSSNAATSSWRITVRQLESLVRLSEALARLNCEREVTAAHVQKAAKLLQNSIVRVEQPDIALDQFEEEDEMDTSVEPLHEQNGQEQGGAAMAGSQKEKESRIDPAKLKLSFEKYKKMADMLVLHLRADEERQGDDFEGVKQSDLVAWYLEMIESELDTEQELHTQKTICERVIKKLTHDDHIFIEVEGGEDPILVVHPNYVVEGDQ